MRTRSDTTVGLPREKRRIPEKWLARVNTYINARNELNHQKKGADSRTILVPRSEGSARQIPIFPNPLSASGQAAVPQECKGVEWALSRWMSSYQLTEYTDPVWALLFKTEDLFADLRNDLAVNWTQPAGSPTEIDSVRDMTVYELLGAHELLVMFSAPFEGAVAVRDLILKIADSAPAVKAKLVVRPAKRDDFWRGWRNKNNVTAYCLPAQKSRVRGEGGRWALSKTGLRLAGSYSFARDARATKAFITLQPRSQNPEEDALSNIFTLSKEYGDIVERVCYHPTGPTTNCGYLEEYPKKPGGTGFSLYFKHYDTRVVLIENLIPCGRFNRLNKFSEELGQSDILDGFMKSTYIAYQAHPHDLLEQNISQDRLDDNLIELSQAGNGQFLAGSTSENRA